MKNFSLVGKSVRRLDAIEKVTGKATFTTDMSLPGMLYARVLRSPHPHAKIMHIDTSEAEKLPGVKGVATWQNTPREPFNATGAMAFDLPDMPPPILDQYIFDNVVRYVGDEVAAVAAVSEQVAEEAVKLIKVDYEPLPAVFDPFEAMKPEAPDIHRCPVAKNMVGGPITFEFGNIEEGFQQCDSIIEETFKVPVQKQVQLETQAALAQVSPNGKITVWSTTQAPHPAKMILSKIFGVPQSKLRVLNPPYVGGGFGVRIGLSGKAEAIAIALAKITGSPVKIVYTREEDFTSTDTRHAGQITVKLGAIGTKLHALKINAVLNSGAYCSFGCEVPAVCGMLSLNVYHLPFPYKNYTGFSVYTNRTPAGAFRGFGNPQSNFALQSVVDMMAEKLGIDPLQFQLQNITQAGDQWFLPYPCTTSSLPECIEEGAKSIGWERRGKLNKPGDTKLRGIGMAVGTHGSNSFPGNVDYGGSIILVQQDGSVTVSSGVPDIGSGTSTTLCQITGEAMGVKLEEINLVFGDTLNTPFEIGSHASRTLFQAGRVIMAAADDAKNQILEYAAGLLEVPAERLDIKDSLIYVKDQKEGKSISVREAAFHAHQRNRQFIGVGRANPMNAQPWHAHFAEVEVDMETGFVRVIKVAAAHDCGKAINPQIVEGQIEGGVLMGVGYATSEEILFNEKGKPLHNSIHKYMIPTAEDTPEIEAIIVETDEPSGPYGAKGVGETSLVPTAGAIANAVYNATGIRFTEIPLTPERVFKKIREHKKM